MCGEARGHLLAELAFPMGLGYVGTAKRPALASFNPDTRGLLRRNLLDQPSQKPGTHQLPSPSLSPPAALLSSKLVAIAWASCLRQELVSEGSVQP